MSVKIEQVEGSDAIERAEAVIELYEKSGMELKHIQILADGTWVVMVFIGENELQRSLDLIHEADMLAIKMWQEAHPGQERVWPDRGQMIFWLLQELDKK